MATDSASSAAEQDQRARVAEAAELAQYLTRQPEAIARDLVKTCLSGDTANCRDFLHRLYALGDMLSESNDHAHTLRLAQSLIVVRDGLLTAWETQELGEIGEYFEATLSQEAAEFCAEAIIAEYHNENRSLSKAASVLQEFNPDSETGERTLAAVETRLAQRGQKIPELCQLLRNTLYELILGPTFDAIRHDVVRDFPGIDLDSDFFSGLDHLFRNEAMRTIGQQAEKIVRQFDSSKRDLAKLETLMSSTQIGFALLDDAGRIHTLVNGKYEPQLQLGKMLPAKLATALDYYDGSVIMQFGEIHITDAHRDINGSVDGLLFLPKE